MEEKFDLKNLVNEYYLVYIDYKKAFEKEEPTKEVLMAKVKELINMDAEEEDFKKSAKNLYMDRSIKWQDLSYHKNKFQEAANLFILTSEEKLEKEIIEEYLEIKKQEYKPFFQLTKSGFKETNKTDIKNIPQEQFDNIHADLKYMYEIESKK